MNKCVGRTIIIKYAHSHYKPALFGGLPFDYVCFFERASIGRALGPVVARGGRVRRTWTHNLLPPGMLYVVFGVVVVLDSLFCGQRCLSSVLPTRIYNFAFVFIARRVQHSHSSAFFSSHFAISRSPRAVCATIILSVVIFHARISPCERTRRVVFVLTLTCIMLQSSPWSNDRLHPVNLLGEWKKTPPREKQQGALEGGFEPASF